MAARLVKVDDRLLEAIAKDRYKAAFLDAGGKMPTYERLQRVFSGLVANDGLPDDRQDLLLVPVECSECGSIKVLDLVLRGFGACEQCSALYFKRPELPAAIWTILQMEDGWKDAFRALLSETGEHMIYPITGLT